MDQNVIFLVFSMLVTCSLATYKQLSQPQLEYTLPQLPYQFQDLEPYIDAATVQVHYKGHHATYTSNMNLALSAWRHEFPEDKLANHSVLQILQNIEKIPEKYRKTMQNQGGGHLNHCIYWACLSANPSGTDRQPQGSLNDDIKLAFGSFNNLYDVFTEEAKKLFGSGYVWLCRKPSSELVVTTTINQNSPVSEGLQPLLTLDVWEHAYYLKYQNRRVNYIENWWRLVNWQAVEQLDTWWKTLKLQQKDEL